MCQTNRYHFTHPHLQTKPYAYGHARTCAHTHARARARAHTHTHTHTHKRARAIEWFYKACNRYRIRILSGYITVSFYSQSLYPTDRSSLTVLVSVDLMSLPYICEGRDVSEMPQCQLTDNHLHRSVTSSFQQTKYSQHKWVNFKVSGNQAFCYRSVHGKVSVSVKVSMFVCCLVACFTSQQSFSFSFSSRWHCRGRKGPYALRPVSQQFPQVVLETVPIFVWLNTDRSRPWRVECRQLPFSTPLSFRRSMLWCSGLSMFTMLLKPLSTSALPSCRPDVISDVLASLSVSSFPLTPACPGQ